MSFSIGRSDIKEALAIGIDASAMPEFEKALKHLGEIRLLVPKYSADGYEGLIEIYEGNLCRTGKR